MTLLPQEKVAFDVAWAQLERAETVDRNVGAMCVLALARLTGKHDWRTWPGFERGEPIDVGPVDDGLTHMRVLGWSEATGRGGPL